MLTEISEITPSLFLTSGIAVTENNLRRLKVRLVINAAKELPVCPLGDGVRMVKIPVADRSSEDLYKYFEDVSRLIHESVQSGENVLVHCVAGVSRSAALCMAYLIRYGIVSGNGGNGGGRSGGTDLMRAYEHVKKRRRIVRPNQGFVAQLMEWEWTVHGVDLICQEYDKSEEEAATTLRGGNGQLSKGAATTTTQICRNL